jgi:mono/diheme cytochrome c family protein
MKKGLAVIVMVLFIAVPVFAADSVTIKAKNGDVTFNHKVHGSAAGCASCHGPNTPGKLSLGGKDAAHKLCIGCHNEKKAGPSKCLDCHKKK